MSTKPPKKTPTTYRRAHHNLNLQELAYAVGVALGMKCFDMEHNWPGNNTVNTLASEEPIVIVDLVGNVLVEHAGKSADFKPYEGGAYIPAMLKKIGVVEIAYYGAIEESSSSHQSMPSTTVKAITNEGVTYFYESWNPNELPLLLAKALVRVRVGRMITLPIGLKGTYNRK